MYSKVKNLWEVEASNQSMFQHRITLDFNVTLQLSFQSLLIENGLHWSALTPNLVVHSADSFYCMLEMTTFKSYSVREMKFCFFELKLVVCNKNLPGCYRLSIYSIPHASLHMRWSWIVRLTLSTDVRLLASDYLWWAAECYCWLCRHLQER